VTKNSDHIKRSQVVRYFWHVRNAALNRARSFMIILFIGSI